MAHGKRNTINNCQQYFTFVLYSPRERGGGGGGGGGGEVSPRKSVVQSPSASMTSRLASLSLSKWRAKCSSNRRIKISNLSLKYCSDFMDLLILKAHVHPNGFVFVLKRFFCQMQCFDWLPLLRSVA